MKNITQLDGFLGIDWAETIAEAKRKFDNRAGVTLITELSNDDCLFYSGGSFAGQQVDLFILQFSDKGVPHCEGYYHRGH